MGTTGGAFIFSADFQRTLTLRKDISQRQRRSERMPVTRSSKRREGRQKLKFSTSKKERLGRSFFYRDINYFAIGSVAAPNHAHKVAVRFGEEQEHDDERKQCDKDKLEQQVAFRHSLQPHDGNEEQRAVVTDNFEGVFQPFHIAEEGELRVDDEQREHDNQHDGENFADDVEHFLHLFEHVFNPPSFLRKGSFFHCTLLCRACQEKFLKISGV